MFGMLSVLAQLQRELIVANTNDGLAARGRVGGRLPWLTLDKAALAQQLYDAREKTSSSSPTSSGCPGRRVPQRDELLRCRCRRSRFVAGAAAARAVVPLVVDVASDRLPRGTTRVLVSWRRLLVLGMRGSCGYGWRACQFRSIWRGTVDRWQQMWSHREQLLRVARRRSMSVQDAEDAVHEAMVRAAERPHVDGDRLGAWLTTVTVRLCVDRYRQLSRDADIGALTGSMLTDLGAASPEEAVCDRAEAMWLADRGAELPERQAEALRLKTEDLEMAQVAERMGLTYKAVESLLGRARRTLRAVLASTLALAMWAWRGRPRAAGAAQAAAQGTAAVTLVIVGLAMPTTSEADGSPPVQPRPYGAVPHRTSDSDLTSLPASNEPSTSSVPTDPGGGPVLPEPAKQSVSDVPMGTGPTRSVQPVPGSSTLPVESAPDLPPLPVTPIPDLPMPPIVVTPVEADRAPDDLPGDLLPVYGLQMQQR